MLQTYSTCSYPGYQDTTTYAALVLIIMELVLVIKKPVLVIMESVLIIMESVLIIVESVSLAVFGVIGLAPGRHGL